MGSQAGAPNRVETAVVDSDGSTGDINICVERVIRKEPRGGNPVCNISEYAEKITGLSPGTDVEVHVTEEKVTIQRK
jgi:hypothetical protein